jgi:hypothetical protein
MDRSYSGRCAPRCAALRPGEAGVPRAAFLAVALLLMASLITASRMALAADPSIVACSAESPSVEPGGAVTVNAWAAAPAGRSLRYDWEAPVGRLESRGRQARWDLAGLRPGVYAAVVGVSDGSGSTVECVVRVLVRQDIGPRSPGPARETGAALLGPGARELEGYGLYSYLLLGAPPGAGVRERYLKSLEAFWAVVPDVRALEEYVPRSELNVAYVPVKAAPGASVTAEWILDNYDYARARSLLRHLPGAMRDGPYLVSALKPLAGGGGSQYLLQDLSSVPPHLAASWVKEFLNQAAQERFWDARTGARLALKLRVTIGVLGEGLPEVRKALDGWIAWAR